MHRRLLLSALFALLSASCATERGRGAHRAPAAPHATVEIPREVSAPVHPELAEAVEMLSLARLDSRSTKIRALLALASALEGEPTRDADAAAVVHEQAARLEKLPFASLDALDVVHTALTPVLDALASAPTPATDSASYLDGRPQRGLTRFLDILEQTSAPTGGLIGAARSAVNAIDAGGSIGFQRQAIVHAFTAAIAAAPSRGPAPRACPR